MKKVRLNRFYNSSKVTLGIITIEGVNHAPIFTLELPWKDNAPNISCIPTGKYFCSAHNGPRYKDVWVVKDVPKRSGILFHVGNTVKDIKGCILLGRSVGADSVMSSALAVTDFRAIIGKSDFTLDIVRS